jgi:hypothetical protein
MIEEKRQFDAAMDTILRADPKAVKAAVDAEVNAHTAERKAKGERKRGRRPSKHADAVLTSKNKEP